MAHPREDWAVILERVLADDALALLKVSRLLNSFLDRWGAYDFRGDWDDLIQETVIASANALRDGRIRDRGAAFGYLKSTARNKFVDRLKKHVREQSLDPVPWDEATEEPLDAPEGGEMGASETARDLREALASLPERQRLSVVAVYVEGQTYPEAAESTGIPLGSLKRALREGLAALRTRLEYGPEGMEREARPP